MTYVDAPTTSSAQATALRSSGARLLGRAERAGVEQNRLVDASQGKLASERLAA
jgi:hypothetical protein